MIIRRQRNLGYSQRSENFENLCVMLQIIIEQLSTIKRYSSRSFIKFERDEGSFEIAVCVCSVSVFTKFLDDPYYEPLAWFMIKLSLKQSCPVQWLFKNLVFLCICKIYVDLSRFFQGMIDHEAIQAWVDAHHQNSLCGKSIMLKTTQTFLKPSSELYQAS